MLSTLHRRGRAVALTAALALFLPAQLDAQPATDAQPAPEAPEAEAPQEENEILVQGTREQLRAIDSYVQGLTVVIPGDPLPRYEPDSFCPGVVGLSDARNREIADRMRRVADVAGVRPAAPGCRTSALVVFVNDKESFLAAFRRQHPVYFRNPLGANYPVPPREDGPAVAWHLVGQLDPQGMPVSRGSAFGPAIVETPARGSRILSMVQPVVSMGVVIIERGALRGLTGTQIADYALMRLLTDRGPQRVRVPTDYTILQALEAPMGSAVAGSVTEWDLAYVRGRYSGHPARYGASQRGAIRQSIRRALRGDREED